MFSLSKTYFCHLCRFLPPCAPPISPKTGMVWTTLNSRSAVALLFSPLIDVGPARKTLATLDAIPNWEDYAGTCITAAFPSGLKTFVSVLLLEKTKQEGTLTCFPTPAQKGLLLVGAPPNIQFVTGEKEWADMGAVFPPLSPGASADAAEWDKASVVPLHQEEREAFPAPPHPPPFLPLAPRHWLRATPACSGAQHAYLRARPEKCLPRDTDTCNPAPLRWLLFLTPDAPIPHEKKRSLDKKKIQRTREVVGERKEKFPREGKRRVVAVGEQGFSGSPEEGTVVHPRYLRSYKIGDETGLLVAH